MEYFLRVYSTSVGTGYLYKNKIVKCCKLSMTYKYLNCYLKYAAATFSLHIFKMFLFVVCTVLTFGNRTGIDFVSLKFEHENISNNK